MDINKLSTLLKSRFGLEVRDMSQPSPKQLRILGRLPQVRMGDWLLGMHHVCTHVARRPNTWTVDFSKNYFVRNGKIVYAWRIIIQAESVEKYAQDIINAFTGAPHSARGEIMEIPLMGASTIRGRNDRGKGASTIGGRDDFFPTRAR